MLIVIMGTTLLLLITSFGWLLGKRLGSGISINFGKEYLMEIGNIFRLPEIVVIVELVYM